MHHEAEANCPTLARTILDVGEPLAVDPREAGRMIGLKPKTLERRRERGLGPPFVRLESGRIRYMVADLKAFLRERRVVPGRG